MAVKFVSAKCPECGVSLNVEEGRNHFFCSYCGAKVVLDNDHEFVIRTVDEANVKQTEAGVKQTEAEVMLRMKEIEYEEKSDQRHRKNMVTTFIAVGVMAALGALFLLLTEKLGSKAMISGIVLLSCAFLVLCIVPAVLSNHHDQEKRERHYTPFSYEASVPHTMIVSSLWNSEKNVKAVIAMCKASGFTNITAVPLHDLVDRTSSKRGRVEQITINGSNEFSEGDVFPKTANVVITFHSMRGSPDNVGIQDL